MKQSRSILERVGSLVESWFYRWGHDNIIRCNDATVLFCDIKSWTAISSVAHADDTIRFLKSYYSVIDSLVKKYKCQKYETIGDAYVICFNVLKKDPEHAKTAVLIAKDILREVEKIRVPINNLNEHVHLRVGIHSGELAAGYVQHNKLQIAGDTVNIASRMESMANTGCIQITNAVYTKLPPELKSWFHKEVKTVKGAGVMLTYMSDCLLVNNSYQEEEHARKQKKSSNRVSNMSIENRHATSFTKDAADAVDASRNAIDIFMALPHENNDHIREYFTARHYGHKKVCNHDEETLQVVKSM